VRRKAAVVMRDRTRFYEWKVVPAIATPDDRRFRYRASRFRGLRLFNLSQCRLDRAIDLYRSMIAFAGRYELIGNRLIYYPDISWNEAWNGTTQERVFKVGENRLETTSVPNGQHVDGRENRFLTRVGAAILDPETCI
jgi:hypothetical protein